MAQTECFKFQEKRLSRLPKYTLICATVTPDANSSEGGWNADKEVDGGAGEI